MTDTAIIRWAASGIAATDLDRLYRAKMRIADLPGDLLGLTGDDVATVDRDAAGWGWFVDPTPMDDFEFFTGANAGEQDHIDLLTAVMHELGHLLGFAHDDAGVMEANLSPGTRESMVGNSSSKR